MKMHREKMSRFVILRQNDGFTMIEMLFSLLILMLISLFVVQLFSIIQTQVEAVNKLHPKEWEVFTMQMHQEIRSSKSQVVRGSGLYLMSGDQLSSIEQYEDKVRRRVDGKGHEVILQNISKFQVKKDGSVIVLVVTDKAGTTFSRSFHPYFKDGNEADE
ncbi:competence type IV pilus minor pilin ComGF [Peribacillus sp. FSL E2-0218]|uniref:competence type IV pilus minor pilin ComGF n=1 Tax=Peribacillus sp. FSL E2-0218 TaxID=2921364 RepID=UPI00160C4BF5